MPIDISEADTSDLATILQLQKDCYMTEAEIYNDYTIPPLQQDMNSLENELNNGAILKAVVNGEIVGSVRAFVDGATCYIGKLIVKNNFQNKGIGRLLLHSMESTFSGCTRFELFTGDRSLEPVFV